MVSKKLFIGNLPYGADDDAVRSWLEKEVGPVQSSMVVYDKDTGMSRGFAFVTFCSSLALPHALKMHGASFPGGARVTVRVAQERR